MMLPGDDVAGRSFGQIANRRKIRLGGAALQIAAQLIQKRLHAAGHDAAVPPLDQRTNRRLLEQIGNRRNPIQQIGRFDGHGASPSCEVSGRASL